MNATVDCNMKSHSLLSKDLIVALELGYLRIILVWCSGFHVAIHCTCIKQTVKFSNHV